MADSYGNMKIKTNRKGSRLETLYDWAEAASFALICVVLVFMFVIRVVGVEGQSMEDTLFDKDRLLMQTSFYTPDRGDIVVIDQYVDKPLIKRIIAVAGDTVYIDPETYTVFLNGERLDEPYVHYPTPPNDMREPVTVPEGYVFVMGDHRTNSRDSRLNEIGLVNEKDIVGRAVFRIWPLSRFGALH